MTHVELGWIRRTLIIVPIKQVTAFPHSMKDGEWLRAWGRWAVITSGTLGFWGLGVRTGCLSSNLASLPLLPGSLRPVQVTDFGFIFCWARLSPGRGGDREKRRGEGTALSAQSWVPLLCLPWPGCHPLPEGPVPAHNGGPDPLWDLLLRGRTSRPGIGLSTLTLSPFVPLQSTRAKRASELKQIHGFMSQMGTPRPGERPWLPEDTAHVGFLHLRSSVDGVVLG